MEEKPIGKITHYYGKIGVAIVKFNREVKVGERVHFKGPHTDFTQQLSSMQYNRVHFKGPHTDFTQQLSSMQYNHQDIESAKKGQEVGIKVEQKVREGDEVYEA